MFFFVVKFRKIAKTKKGPTKGLYYFKVVILIFPPNFNHRANQKVALMMDGLDPLSFKSNGHYSLVVTMLAEHKTCRHLTQALDVLHRLYYSELRFHHH
jgi:hypothetical protein